MKIPGVFPFKQKYHPVDEEIIREYNNIRTIEQRKYLCHAPFKSMTFFHTGYVLVCWYNKLFPIGKYPNDSVHDIWFTGRAEKLRKFILHNDLSYGCADCRKNLTNRDFYAAGAWRYDFLPEITDNYPVSVDFQISSTCNLQCIMCSGELSSNVRINREKKELYKNPYDDDFFRQIEPFIPHLKDASFSGGEPFIANEFFRIWDMQIALNPGVRNSVTTNGNILNEKVWSYLDALSFNISLSLDAITEETYRKIRVKGDFNKVISNMMKYVDYTTKKGTEFAVKICVIRQNWHEIPKLADFLNEKNISFLFNSVFFPPYCSLWNLDSKKLKEIIACWKEHQLSDDTFIRKQNAERYYDLVRQAEIWYDEALKREQKNFDQMTVDELREIFLNNAEVYISNELKYFGKEIPFQMEQLKNLFDKMIKDSIDENSALQAMRYYAAGPVARHLAELNIRDYEKNLDRFNQTGLNPDELYE